MDARDSRELAAEASLAQMLAISGTCGLERRASSSSFSLDFHYNNLVHFLVLQTHQLRSQTTTEQDKRSKQ